uniref:Bacterial repeat domain-containing protein n=1 Tax=Solibacter usitatus (strain Ellin6076) TaxID=234267 RepID=Q01RB6_SOLUE
MELRLRNITSAGIAFRTGFLLLSMVAARAQAPMVVGYPANFDTFNNTGAPIYGFEIEADGIQPSDVTRVFPSNFPVPAGSPCVIRYCSGTVTPFPGGVYIRWMSPWDSAAQQFTISTPVYNGTVANGESCWTGGLGTRYPTAGCEHFGISTLKNPTNIIYRWLVPDPNNPGNLMYYAGGGTPIPGAPAAPPYVPLPQPVINVIPPVKLGAQPVVDFQIPAPPPPAPVQFGPAQWVKVYKLELPNQVDLNDLLGGNPAVPEAPQPAEMEWKLLQYNPHSANSGVLHNQAQLGNGSHAVVRRYEHYQYTGTFDPLTHEALCADPTCSAPGPGELGAIIGAQNAAANLETPSISVTKIGSGNVNGAGGAINCGVTCSANLTAGASESLTATPPSNGVFNGWTGACTGSQQTCAFTAQGAMTTTARFTTVYTLSIGRGGNGSVSGTPNGEFGTFINCGSSCSAKIQQGTTVTLTATPAAGLNFIGWSGSCSGLAPTCSVTVNADTKVQATFK